MFGCAKRSSNSTGKPNLVLTLGEAGVEFEALDLEEYRDELR